MKESVRFESVEQYLSSFPPPTRKKLVEMQQAIQKGAPGAAEVIAYNMPAYRLEGPLVYFAGYAKHIGFYPMPSALEVFKKELTGYKASKGAVQFPLDKPLPLALVTKMVRWRVSENKELAKEKEARKKKK